MDADEARAKPKAAAGDDLSLLSVDEITARIALFEAEILRLKAAREAKLASRDAAASVFKI